MPVKDKDLILKEIREKVEELKAKGMDEEAIEESHEIHEIHEKHSLGVFVNGEKKDDVDVEPGESVTFILKLDNPGEYYYVCLVLHGTFPKTHADLGMWGKIIVE